MRMPISDWIRQLSGQGALDNVAAVLAARASVDAELDALAVRVSPAPVATRTPAAA